MKNFVIFGASGDLARNYLFPVFEKISSSHQFNYFGFGRSPAVIPRPFIYIQGSYDRDGLLPLAKKIDSDTIFYFAIPTRFELIKSIIDGLIYHRLIGKNTRLVLEKPFGTDFLSAKKLMTYLESSVGQENIFLVDHYLTKNFVKNIVSLRFSNAIFRNLWNSKFIKEINITATETHGIDNRGEYYDQTGVIRDMFQNHLLQLLALITMNESIVHTHESYVAEKTAILKSVVIKSKFTQLGQYQSYRQELGVDPQSDTETFVKIRLGLNHPNWKNVPINIVSGKKMEQKITEINVVFRQEDPSLTPNQLTITLQPQNDIILTLNSSFETHKSQPQPVTLNLGPLDSAIYTSTAYENILHDLIHDININTPSFEEILLQWEITDKILNTPHLRDKLFTY